MLWTHLTLHLNSSLYCTNDNSHFNCRSIATTGFTVDVTGYVENTKVICPQFAALLAHIVLKLFKT